MFADVFNHYIYVGEQVISLEQLKEWDPTEIMVRVGIRI